jgi:hypothetical protein
MSIHLPFPSNLTAEKLLYLVTNGNKDCHIPKNKRDIGKK